MAAASSPEQPLPVRTVSRMIAEWVGRLGAVWIEGQVTDLVRRPGAAVGFCTLRDVAANVSLPVAVPQAVLAACDPPLADGARVVVQARPELHFQRGRLQLVVAEIRPVGLGALLARLERLRELLRQEGLFDRDRKRALPFLPRTVGLVCGRESAARHDVEENARRRWPAVRIEVREVPVQGPYAVAAVIDAVRELDRAADVDVIVVARGGGSLEDLLPFSDEALCRAVAAVTTPLVSAIGHESDTPLLDLVADVRASTPTDAGKLVVPDVAEEVARIAGLRRRAWRCLDERAGRAAADVTAYADRAHRAVAARVERAGAEVSAYADRAHRAVSGSVERAGDEVAQLRARVAALSPAATLERGYAIVRRADGSVVRDPAKLAPGDPVDVRVAGGRIAASVTGVTPTP